jgi:hypothetical protein
VAAECLVSLGEPGEKLRARWHGAGKDVGRARLARMALALLESLEVTRVLDLEPAREGAFVVSDLEVAVEDAGGEEVGNDDQGPLPVRMRNGVVVAIEADVEGLADVDFDPLVTGEGLVGERAECRAVALESSGDRVAAVLGPAPFAGDRRAPLVGLAVGVVETREGPGGKRVVADVADRPFDASLLIAAVRGDGPRLVAVVSREGEELRVEADRVADAIEHDALQIVVEDGTRHPGPAREGLLVPGEEVRKIVAGEEPKEDRARVGEDHDEADEGPLRLADADRTEVPPVHLGLITGEGPQPQVGLPGRRRPVAPYDGAKGVRPPLVSALADHVVEARCGQPWILLERLDDERDVGVDLRRAQQAGSWRAVALENPANGRVVETELRSDGAGRPALGVVKAKDARLKLGSHHPGSSPERKV